MNTILETVCLVCNTVRGASRQGLSFQNVLTYLRRGFKAQGFFLKIRSDRDKKLSPDEFYVNAYYDAEEDKNQEIPIEVVVHHNFDKTAIWDTKQTTSFLIQIFDAVVHEYKHQRQSTKRKYVVYTTHIKEPYDVYLADTDEIDAYAFSIAIELCRSLGKYRALRYMGRFATLARLKFNGQFVSPCLSSYFGQFGNINHPIIKILAKKVYVRLQKVDTDFIFM